MVAIAQHSSVHEASKLGVLDRSWDAKMESW